MVFRSIPCPIWWLLVFFQPVSAFNYGARIYSRVKNGFLFGLLLGTVIMAVLGFAGMFAGAQMVAFFRNDPEVIEIGIHAMHRQCLALWLEPLSVFGNMLFQSIGKAKVATFLAALRSGLVMIPAVLLLTALFGLSGLESAQAVSQVISALVSLPFIVTFLHHLPADGTYSY